MLNGIDPIIIFQFKKLLPELGTSVAKIPVVAESQSSFPLPFIPIYLSEKLTGIYIDNESKSMDIDTNVDTVSNGTEPKVNQRAITSTVKIEMVASKDSIGVSIFSAMSDLIFPKVTSKEYSITYLHGAIVVFDALLHSFSITQEANTDLYKISLELVNITGKKDVIPQVLNKTTGTVPL